MTVHFLRRTIATLLLAGSLVVSTQAHSAILQCAIFARQETQVTLTGDAYTWWEQAAGRYHRAHAPMDGGVLVFKRFGKMRSGHVAVVTRIEGDRRIVIDHANWATPGMAKGRVSRGVPVIDVSAAGDWSLVRVWNPVTQQFGTRSYPTYGFIDPSRRGTYGEVLSASASLAGEGAEARPVKLKPSQALALKQQQKKAAAAAKKGKPAATAKAVPAKKAAPAPTKAKPALQAVKAPAAPKAKPGIVQVAEAPTPSLKPSMRLLDSEQKQSNVSSRARPGQATN
ncbi:MAG TPA: CHAP domain-containing protein [Alphaproteobacteria bacterium]|nr:CHAP domain-containing protein [Alphaproteobacteria bacterium]